MGRARELTYIRSRTTLAVVIAGVTCALALANSHVRAQPEAPPPDAPASSAAPAPDSTDAPNAGTGAPAQPASECTTLELRLDGASAAYGEPDTSFREEWRPALRSALQCLARPEHARSCLEVQGHYDERSFEPAVTRALGSDRAAQLYRARARAEAVLSELHALGLEAARARARPPPTGPTYRGASITLATDCLPEPAESVLPAWASSPEALAGELRQRGLLRDPEPASPPPAPPPPAPPPEPSPLWLEGGLGLGVMLGEPDAFVLGGPQVGLGWTGERFYVRGAIGLAVGGLAEQRAAFEWAIAFGYRAQPWLTFGVLGGHRIASEALFSPWLSQAWRIGVESSQRVLELGEWSLWITEAVSPLGERIDRAVVVGGTVFEIDDRRSYALRLDVGVSMRGQIF